MELEPKPAEPYSKQLCLFAYEGVRVTGEQQLGVWLDRLGRGEGDSVLESLWAQAAQFCQERGVEAAPLPDGTTSGRVTGDGYQVLWIDLPNPEYVPEPAAVGIVWPVGVPDSEARATAAYYAEKSSTGTGYVLARMSEGTHAILGSLFSGDRDEFLEQIAARESQGDASEDEQGFFGTPALEHSMAFSHYVTWTRGGDDDSHSDEGTPGEEPSQREDV